MNLENKLVYLSLIHTAKVDDLTFEQQQAVGLFQWLFYAHNTN